MTAPLLGRVAVVTGAARGLGREHARTLSEAGATLALMDVARPELEQLAGELRGSVAVTVDVTHDVEVGPSVDRVVSELGGVDILVNNAGGTVRAGPEVDEASAWRQTLELNLTASWLLCRAVAPIMRDRGGGRIVNTTSNTALRPPGDVPVSYIAAKAGVIGLTRALAREWGVWGVTVNAVAPGFTLHEGLTRHRPVSQLAAMSERAVQEQCLPRASTPADISAAVLFLVGPGGGFVTGQVVTVDGGWTFG